MQSFDKLIEKIAEFKSENTIEGMERIEIEGVIQQVYRLHSKLDKFIKLVKRKIF